jgi:hypothetical protein
MEVTTMRLLDPSDGQMQAVHTRAEIVSVYERSPVCNRRLTTLGSRAATIEANVPFRIKEQGYGRAQNLPFRINNMSMGRKEFVIAHIGAIALTIALAVGLCALVSLAIRLLAGR